MSAQDLNLESAQTTSFCDITQNRADIEKSGRERADFDARGKFAPGNCANPGGRPKTRHLTEAYKQILEVEGADKYARVIADIALDGKKDSDRIAAMQELTDRVEGKATQNIRHAGVFLVAAPGAETMAALDDWAGDE